jgi:hypothetical protein
VDDPNELGGMGRILLGQVHCKKGILNIGKAGRVK